MEPKPALLKILDVISVILLLIATGLVFFYAPMEAVMGQVQRVFYFHVAAGWVGMLSFLAAAANQLIHCWAKPGVSGTESIQSTIWRPIVRDRLVRVSVVLVVIPPPARLGGRRGAQDRQ